MISGSAGLAGAAAVTLSSRLVVWSSQRLFRPAVQFIENRVTWLQEQIKVMTHCQQRIAVQPHTTAFKCQLGVRVMHHRLQRPYRSCLRPQQRLWPLAVLLLGTTHVKRLAEVQRQRKQTPSATSTQTFCTG